MKVDIGVIGALEEEIKELASLIEEREVQSVGSLTFYVGKLGKKTVAVAKCGVGKVFAAICAQTMIMKYSPALLINTGVGGALDDALTTLDVVVADKLVQHDMDTSAIGDPVGLISGINRIYFDADARAVELLCDIAAKNGINALVGTVATGDKFISETIDKERIKTSFGALACEMEGGAIAHTAYVNQTPFAVIRAISDSANGEATMDYPTFLPLAAKRSTLLTLALIENY